MTKSKRFVEQVILGPEFGRHQKIVSRWIVSPTVSLFGATGEHRTVVQKVIADLNSVLQPTKIALVLRPDNDSSATIQVYFAKLADIPSLARKHGVRYEEGNWGYFATFWDDGHRINRAVIFFAEDMLFGDKLVHFAYEEITQSLGPLNDSDEFPDSIFYQNGPDGGNAQHLSALDKHLLLWLYTYAQPGDNRKTVTEQFKNTWKTIAPKN